MKEQSLKVVDDYDFITHHDDVCSMCLKQHSRLFTPLYYTALRAFSSFKRLNGSLRVTLDPKSLVLRRILFMDIRATRQLK